MDTVNQTIRYLIVICLMVIMLGTALVLSLVSKNIGWLIYRRWAIISLKVFGVEVETRFDIDSSQIDGGGVMVGLTQQSLLDPTAGYASWNKRVLSIWNFEYALIPFFGWITLILGWIIVRQRPEQAKRQLRKAVQHVADGGMVYLSAEGQRSVDGSLNPYKKGPVVLAIQAQAPIHPMYIAGSRACLPTGEWKIRPGKIVVRYLPPIATKGLTYEDRDALLERIRTIGETVHSECKNAAAHNGQDSEQPLRHK